MRYAFVFGNGGHAKVIASLLDRDVIFVDHSDEDEFFARVDEKRKESEVFLGVGDNEVRKRLYLKLCAVGIVPARCIAKHSFVAKNASIGPGSVICPGAVVMTHAVIGANVIINTLSSIDHDCVVGEHSQFAVGVSLCGGVKVGVSCFFGVKSAVFPGVSIGDDAVVRGGSLVIKDVPSNVVVSGNPASIVRTI